MKKLIGTLIVLLAGMAFSFADNFVNITVPVKFTYAHQKGYNKAYDDEFGYYFDDLYLIDNSISTVGLNSEFLTTIGNSSFCLGAKLGCDFGSAKGKIEGALAYDVTYEPSGTALGWTVAPALGWVKAKKTTKKQIMIYPVEYTGYNFMNCVDKNNNDKSFDKNFNLTTFKSGLAFSWQWGSKNWHGFEIGFDYAWYTMLKYDNEDINEDPETGYGFDAYIAYKFTIAK